MILVRVGAFVAGLALVARTLISAVRTFVLPRSAPDRLTGLVFRLNRWLFGFRLRWAKTYQQRDRVMAFFAPTSLLLLLPTWLALVALGFAAMFWGSGIPSWREAFTISGSSLLTLGFAKGDSFVQLSLAFAEATIGLILVALLIAYLPTMYNAFSRRETAVTLLEVRAGSPPSAVEMIERYHRIHTLARLSETWESWETWFAEVEESHTSLAALVFFRSPQPQHSWVTAAGAVLDAASLILSTVDVPWEPKAALCIRAGYLALRRVADFFGVAYQADPHFPEDDVSVSRGEFDAVYDRFGTLGIPVKADRDRAWQDFGGWRVNYDAPLLALCRLTMAPLAPWSSDRAARQPTAGEQQGRGEPPGRSKQRPYGQLPE